MSEPLTVGINKLELRAGDVLLVRLPGWATQENVEDIKSQLAELLPGLKSVVVTGDIGITHMRAVEPEPAEHDAPAIVTVP